MLCGWPDLSLKPPSNPTSVRLAFCTTDVPTNPVYVSIHCFQFYVVIRSTWQVPQTG